MTRRWRGGAVRLGRAALGHAAVGLLSGIRRLDPDRTINLAARFMRRVGPWLPEHKIGRANLRASFPDKTDAEIERILAEVWANLGRVGVEFAHLDRLWSVDLEHPERARIDFRPEDLERFIRLRDDGKPALIFAAHLGNWELSAVCAADSGLDAALLYRRPNIAEIDRFVREARAANMGTLVPAGLDAPLKLANALKAGVHVGMLVDQHYTRGVDVTFFGRRCKANPLLARLARQIECPIHGTRIVRLPNNRFRAEITEEIPPVRDADGAVDVAATMQAITNVVEDWVREYPEQWLWLHRRWR